MTVWNSGAEQAVNIGAVIRKWALNLAMAKI
jgi:hypothetical protein